MKRGILFLFLCVSLCIQAQNLTFMGLSMHTNVYTFLEQLKTKKFKIEGESSDYDENGAMVTSTVISGKMYGRQVETMWVQHSAFGTVDMVVVGYIFPTMEAAVQFKNQLLPVIAQEYPDYQQILKDGIDGFKGDGGGIAVAASAEEKDFSVVVIFKDATRPHHLEFRVMDEAKGEAEVSKCVMDMFSTREYENLLGTLPIPDTVTIGKKRYVVAGFSDDALGFDGYELDTLELPATMRVISQKAFQNCPKLEDVSVAKENPYFKSVNGVLYSKDGTVLCIHPNKTGSRLDIEAGVTRIADYAFMGNRFLKFVKMPKSLKSIGKSAFSSCSDLFEVRLNDGLESIGDSAFSLTNSLSAIFFGSPASLRSVGTGVGSISTLYVPDENIDNFDLLKSDAYAYRLAAASSYVAPQYITLSEVVENIFSMKGFVPNPWGVKKNAILEIANGKGLYLFDDEKERSLFLSQSSRFVRIDEFSEDFTVVYSVAYYDKSSKCYAYSNMVRCPYHKDKLIELIQSQLEGKFTTVKKAYDAVHLSNGFTSLFVYTTYSDGVMIDAVDMNNKQYDAIVKKFNEEHQY